MVPEPRKQAAKGQKQILKENQETVVFYTCVAAVASGIYLATTWLMFWKEFSFKYQMLFGLTSVIYLSALALMKRFSRARFASDGGVVDAGVDLNMPNGMAE
ncbi:hypothetical protein RvY_07221 [Ramazzottius varieornatus]|uniref:Transmembrane protein 208 n=1 Tax=Ramazzottius varieornatus TaxID=947166 RepID=A0A1D1V4K2_RAMVA|nr:hypothetical protein RvY_07221 [Ramazzottius varieornatus]